MKKIIGIIVCLAIAAAIGAYFFVSPEFEKKQAVQVEAFIDQLPGDLKAESIKTSFWGNQLEILGLKGTMPGVHGGDIKIDVKRIALSGVNMTPGQGVANLVDEVVFEDLTVHGSMPASVDLAGISPEIANLVVTQELKEVTVKGLRGDYAALQSTFASDSRYAVLHCLATKFFAAQISASEYAYQVPSVLGTIQMRVKSTLVKDFSGLKHGPATIEGFSFYLGNSEVASIGNMTVESCQIPDTYQMLIKSQELDAEFGDIVDDFGEAFFKGDKENAFFVKGMVIKDLKIGTPGLESITLAEMNAELSFSKDDWILKYGIREMNVPVSLYQRFGGGFPQLARAHNKALNMDAMVDFAVHSNNGKNPVLTVNRAFIEDKSLANAELSFTASADDFEKARLQGNALLTKGKFSFEDKGLINSLVLGEKHDLAEGIPPEKINDPAYLRGVIANKLALEVRDNLPHSAEKLLTGWFELLKAPGTLTMVYESKPERPFIIGASMQRLMKFPVEDLTVEFVPAK